MESTSYEKIALIVGANRGIGLGFVQRICQDPMFSKIYATYRELETATELLALANQSPTKVTALEMDVTEEEAIAQSLASLSQTSKQLNLVINCAGILHNEHLEPEKSLKQIHSEHLLRYFQINSIGSLLLAKHLLPLLRHGERSILATISAKVGSIGDNQLGGWYGYRASKAALNMFMRNVAIEYHRTSPRTIVALLHPGTTDTRLSKPFQRSVPPEKLFPVERTVSQLLTVLENLTEEDSGQFFNWDGSRLPW
jgi:NAD(P)-dependent dehydrogenase (short-subunit alcohol dehydrogenase family)